MPLLIKRTIENIEKFRNKIVFAPNGFGKTQFSLYLKSELVKKGKNVGLYTRRELEDLVKISDKHIFVGKTATILMRKETILDTFKKSKPFDFDIKTDGRYKVTDYYSKSFFYKKFDYNPRKKIEPFLKLIKDSYSKESKTIRAETLHDIDISLDYSLYQNALDISLESINERLSKAGNEELPDVIVDSLNRLFDYLSTKRSNKCLLCGTVFESSEELIKNISNNITQYISASSGDSFNLINSLHLGILNLLKNKKLEELKLFFKDNKIAKTDIAGVITGYVVFCNEFIKSFAKNICDLELGVSNEKETVFSLAQEFVDKEKLLESERANLELSNTGFVGFVNQEIKKLFNTRGETIELSPTLDSIEIKENGKPVKKNLVEYFSESQMKRIALIILMGYVRYLNYDCVILDDPIDSYDDYYLDVAASYIASIISELNGKDWYIFTNSYDCSFNLSSYIPNGEFIVFSDKPDMIFDDSIDPTDPLTIDCNSSDFQSLNVNEMVLLSKYSDKSTKVNCSIEQDDFDNDLSFHAFTVTLRNMRDILHKNFGGITMGYACPVFDEMVSEHIENHYMHYNPSESSKTSMKDIYYTYVKILDINNLNMINFRVNKTSAIDERERIVKQPFSTFTGKKLLNIILYKIVLISYLKFCLEKKLLDGLSSLGLDSSSLPDTHSLGNKIKKAKTIASGNSAAEYFVKSVEEVHANHRTLINNFDHALNRMIPPYLSASFSDIKRFKNDVFSI